MQRIILISIVTLVIGLGIGYQVGESKQVTDTRGTHMMPGGHMMVDGDMSMSDMMSSMNNELRGKTGDDFDKAFLTEMIVHHEGAVEMAKLALTNARHKEIKDLASAIISAQNTEIVQMKEWLKTWFNK
jgi:uncharacterized protein (DUF305 family)